MTWVVGEDPKGHALRSAELLFTAEAGLGPRAQTTVPEKIIGKLESGLPLMQFLELTAKPGIQVNYQGRGYRLTKQVDDDGAFELSILVKP